jgi:predicted ferric reductase
MTDVDVAQRRARLVDVRAVGSLGAARRSVLRTFVLLVICGNAAALVWLWVHGGNVTRLPHTGDILTSIGRITGLLSAYLALLQVVLLSRLPWLERLYGFDRLTVWHRWNGHACIDLVVAHVVFTVWGYALLDRLPLSKEISTMLTGGVYPGMITATVGTALLIGVVATSIVIVRRRLRYELWYAVHLAAYAGIALAWFHEIPTGNELVLDTVAADYWRALFAATFALVIVFRLALPLVNAFRFGLRVESVVEEAPGVVSVTFVGRRLVRLGARAGQFFLWRFLAKGHWWASHPFSLSQEPDGRRLRITVKALGDHSARMADLKPGTRVIAEGPFGVFTGAVRRRDKVALIAGGIGITPIRALAEEMDGDVVVLYRVISEGDLIFADELTALERSRGISVQVIAGDHATAEGSRLLSPAHLRDLVPDIEDREVYVCGPPAMIQAIARSVRRAGVSSRFVHVERFAL